MRQSFIQILVFSTGLLALSACNSVSVDSTGAILPEYASQIDSIAGSYTGALVLNHSSTGYSEPLQGSFTVTLARDGNRPVVTADGDVLGANCGSSIGKLLSLQVGGSWDAIAAFEFNSGICSTHAKGTEAVLYLSRNGRALFTLYKRTLRSSPTRPEDRLEYRADLSREQ